MIDPLPTTEICRRASIGLGKVDQYGLRGVTMLSVDETEAMALVLAMLGLVPTRAGEPAPTQYFIPQGESK